MNPASVERFRDELTTWLKTRCGKDHGREPVRVKALSKAQKESSQKIHDLSAKLHGPDLHQG
jgi:hypothetical protein